MKLLRIDSSARTNSVSRRLTLEFVEEWKKYKPEGEVMERDLVMTAFPHIADQFPSTAVDPSMLTMSQRAYLSLSDTLIQELLAANIVVVVIGAPMHNFTISWELKAWIDQVVRLGKTIAYGPNVLADLSRGKRPSSLHLVAARIVLARRGMKVIFKNHISAMFFDLWE